MIEVYKIPHDVYEEWVTYELVNEMDQAWARGHPMKLIKHRRLKKHNNFFTSRVVNVRNSLKKKVVYASRVNAFENLPNKLWSNHPMKYNLDAECNSH